jgi:[ribosomal protein S18]-alanine N-acetyltransferase
VNFAGPEIGLAAPSEAGAIAQMSRDEIEHGLGWSWTAPRVRRAMQDRSSNVIVAREGSRMVGFAILSYAAEHAHLNLLGVARDRRRRGIARALLAWLETTMRVAGIAAVQVELRATNGSARAFYESLGFELINVTPRYYHGRESALHMVKELSPLP